MNLVIFVLTVIILLFCFCTSLGSNEVFYIRTSSENSSCLESFCLTLSDYAATSKNSSHKANTTLIFLPGNHSLGSTLTVKYGNNFSMIVLNHSRVIISCEWDTKFQFFLSSNVYISGLVITRCENSHQIRGVNKFMLINCIISYHESTAMYFSYSNVNITNTSFISNWGGTTEKISNVLTYSYVEAGAAAIFSACNATISKCVFKDNRAETGAAIFSIWESKLTIVRSIFVEIKQMADLVTVEPYTLKTNVLLYFLTALSKIIQLQPLVEQLKLFHKAHFILNSVTSQLTRQTLEELLMLMKLIKLPSIVAVS